METSIVIQPRTFQPAPRRRAGSNLAAVFMSAGLLAGFLEAWLSRNDMYTDGISYLDLGDALLGGHWHTALNLYWSPLYPALLGGVMAILKPSAIWEFPVVHLVNFAVFALAIAAFQFFLGGFLKRRSDTVPESIWIALGYTLFLWSALRLIGVGLVSPDLCVATCIFFAAGILERIAFDPAPWRYALLGLALGIGYLAKAPVLPIAGLMLLVSIFLVHGLSRRISCLALGGAAFAISAGPWMVALSAANGRPTFGDSWSLNVAWYVNDSPRYHWQGETALHPTRKIFDVPPVYEFNGPISGTYPIWYDPAYWEAGIRPHFTPGGFVRQIRANAFDYFQLLFHLQVGIAVVCLAWFLMCGRGRIHWILLVPAVAAFIMFVPVHVEDRMLGAYVVLLWLGLFASAAVVAPEQRRFAYYSALALVIIELARLGLSVAGTAASRVHEKGDPQAEIAQALHDDGIAAGDKVAWIRPQPFTAVQNYAWARLAKVQIIAEIPSGQASPFWRSDARTQEQVLEAVQKTGAKAMIATSLPGGPVPSGWIPLGKNGYFIRMLND